MSRQSPPRLTPCMNIKPATNSPSCSTAHQIPVLCSSAFKPHVKPEPRPRPQLQPLLPELSRRRRRHKKKKSTLTADFQDDQSSEIRPNLTSLSTPSSSGPSSSTFIPSLMSTFVPPPPSNYPTPPMNHNPPQTNNYQSGPPNYPAPPICLAEPPIYSPVSLYPQPPPSSYPAHSSAIPLNMALPHDTVHGIANQYGVAAGSAHSPPVIMRVDLTQHGAPPRQVRSPELAAPGTTAIPAVVVRCPPAAVPTRTTIPTTKSTITKKNDVIVLSGDDSMSDDDDGTLTIVDVWPVVEVEKKKPKMEEIANKIAEAEHKAPSTFDTAMALQKTVGDMQMAALKKQADEAERRRRSELPSLMDTTTKLPSLLDWRPPEHHVHQATTSMAFPTSSPPPTAPPRPSLTQLVAQSVAVLNRSNSTVGSSTKSSINEAIVQLMDDGLTAEELIEQLQEVGATAKEIVTVMEVAMTKKVEQRRVEFELKKQQQLATVIDLLRDTTSSFQ